ncbi:Serine phosphatase RsbU, regulator of sigma subunit [Reichenbachiella faecimaris]|uniref:Serine phosphatase RsbU, regulator of sigma subunit n=1 Tax=Reichenbachiella faecimaris TaxID=692418 RepID=A0A1W2GFH3_REIFA|nr:GAF domain-containing SpoIIE family protein phosphatase [Reichenbachiella faecimaris]SMD35026.1 Serine phosphatase RsbU, regulator of sigma subunit [Reichenbachiella faecimaris]
MISQKGIIRLSVILGIIFWSLFTIVDLMALFSELNGIAFGFPPFVSNALLTLFIISLILFYRFNIGQAESVNFVDLLWRVFVSGLIATVVTLCIEFFFTIFASSKVGSNTLIINFLYHVNIGLVIAFLISTFIVWKRLILYQKSKSLLATWQLYEYALLGTLIFDLFSHDYQDPAFLSVYGILVLIGLYLSFNLKWIAYLNFKQKWRSILFVLLVVIYIWYFFKTLMFFSEKVQLVRDLLDSVFILALITFIVIYCVIALLVILFNLPTTSVFEKKLEEAVNFQRLSQSIPAGESEEKVYEILLDSSVSAVYSEAAWLQISDPSKNVEVTLTHNLDKGLIPVITKAVNNSRFKKILNSDFDRNPKSLKISANLKDVNFRSILQFPVTVKGEKIGVLALLKEVNDGFNKEMIDIIDTFVNQASISVENFRLLNDAIVNERYKEELKIANRVQNKLLPERLEPCEAYDIHAYSKAADEVGGDYYDVYPLDEERTALIIGDVSGKGTSAAFHMAQMKGVFQSLVQLDLDPKEFLVHANNALSRCLESTSFITVSFFVIDSKSKKVNFARAGHCPSLYYNAETGKTEYFKNRGLGLGILRNFDFHKYVQVNEFTYQAKDVLVLYTDGITEACNNKKEQFGYERLQSALTKYADQSPSTIQQEIIKDLYEFCGKESLNDDYTLLIVKFN